MKTLSDKKEYYIKKGVPNYYYEEDDVKKFIKDLKEEFGKKGLIFTASNIIDKLAGDKLNGN